MNPKVKSILLWALLVSLVLVCGVTIAYMYRATNEVTNQFVKGMVDCVVHEVADGTSATNGTVKADSKTSIKVKNTGNIDAYLRVRLVSYWVDEDESIMPVASAMPKVDIATGWKELSDNTYIYTSPVAPGAFTGELLESAITLQTSEEGYRQVVEVFADAIQSEPADAVTEAWGYPTSTN